MNVLGVDVGFSAIRETSAFCLLSVDSERRTIGLIERPKRFALRDALGTFRRLSQSYPDIEWVSVDAPLTPTRLAHRPASGRSVDKRFSKGAFHSSQGGPQPGSISVPLQGWPLYEAGMVMVEDLREARLGRYIPFEGFMADPPGGIIECIPKLTQALLVPREVVRGRKGTVDDYLFPLLCGREGPYRRVLDLALGGSGFSAQVEGLIAEIAWAPMRHHEELAAFVAAIQGVAVAIGRSSIVGRAGDSEGYYALPHREHWHADWTGVFGSTRADGVEVIDLGGRGSVGPWDAESAVPRPV